MKLKIHFLATQRVFHSDHLPQMISGCYAGQSRHQSFPRLQTFSWTALTEVVPLYYAITVKQRKAVEGR